MEDRGTDDCVEKRGPAAGVEAPVSVGHDAAPWRRRPDQPTSSSSAERRAALELGEGNEEATLCLNDKRASCQQQTTTCDEI